MREPWKAGSISLRWRRCCGPSSRSTEARPRNGRRMMFALPACSSFGSPVNTSRTASGWASMTHGGSVPILSVNASPCSRCARSMNGPGRSVHAAVCAARGIRGPGGSSPCPEPIRVSMDMLGLPRRRPLECADGPRRLPPARARRGRPRRQPRAGARGARRRRGGGRADRRPARAGRLGLRVPRRRGGARARRAARRADGLRLGGAGGGARPRRRRRLRRARRRRAALQQRRRRSTRAGCAPSTARSTCGTARRRPSRRATRRRPCSTRRTAASR